VPRLVRAVTVPAIQNNPVGEIVASTTKSSPDPTTLFVIIIITTVNIAINTFINQARPSIIEGITRGKKF
jgi:hypothetical protein